ncbi:SLAP domain-containing protein [Lactobacillus sp.]|uniref:SLAP domain-containing protein n=1 Tax=Lactobacillus sp. TaxID=1591 RepID=UPI0025CF05DE|nr:SLAP domain-containing protein [Lactobacillus sp.]MCO6534872.1 SLAP domain-containing protein [Lactobacillus sp.]
MLGKNNYKERLKRMEMQSKQDHFSIRKLSIGAASVLLGFTFFGLNSQTAKADTVDPKQEVSENVNTKSVQSSSTSSGKKTETQDTQSDATKENDSKLSTFTGLTSFFKGTDKVTVKNDNSNNNQSLSKSSEKQSVAEKDNQIANSAEKPATDQKNSDQSQSSALTKSGQSNTSDITGSTDVKEDASKLTANSTTNQEETDELAGTDNPNLAVTNQEQKIQTRADIETGSTPTIINGAAYIYNWDQFRSAYANANVSEIDIMKDIANPNVNDQETGFDIPGRTLLITSGGNTRHIIDFKGSHPNLTGSQKLQITYRNLTVWCSDWYGIIKTDQYGYDATKNNTAIITLDDIDFHGSQMLYVGSHNEIHLKNNITAETINYSYTSPVDGGTAGGKDNKQQLFEFTNNDNNIYFDTGCTFTGTTYGGNVIQMSQGNGNIHVEQGATVTLNPLGNADGSLGNNPSETTGTTYGIYIAGSGKIDVEGVLNINVGKSKSNASQAIYNGTRNAVQAKAIGLNDANSSFNIGSGGSVNITTNGNISNNTNTSLIFDGGNFIINPNGSLKITGEDMGDYSGTLVAIASSADIENGTFEIRLKNGGSTNAGNGAITLIDATGNLTVNNPESLVLDAHLNKNPATSLIGNNQVTITNVRQKLNLSSIVPSLKDLTLPPYHLLKVKKDSNGNIQVAPNGIEVLNGQQVFDTATLQKIQDDKDLGPIFKNLPDNILSELKQLAGSGSATYDDVFSGIINYAFSDPSNIGYNDISFIPANPSGFLDINPANVKVSYNEDGTSTITGAILNYTDATDGVNSDGLFSKILPGGTNAYVRAYVKDSSGKETAIKSNSEIDDPYNQTADSGKTLSHDFTAMAKYNEQTGRYEFSFNIPAETTKALKKGDKIELYPNANFIEYNPLATKLPESDSNHRPIAVDVLAAAQDTAAQEINDELQKINNDQSIKHNKDLDDAIANAKQVAAKSDSSNYDSGKSVYGADNIPEVEKRKKDALSDLQTAYETAQKESQALSDQVKASKTAITDAAKEAENRVRSTSLTNDEQQTYIDAIEKAKDEALATKDDANFDPAKSIYGSDNVDDVKNKETKATNIFNKEAAKGELDGFAKDCETTLGLDSTNNKGVEDAKTAAITVIDKIADSVAPASDNTTDVNNSENDGKTNILDAVKAAAKDQLSNSNTSVQGAIGKIDGLSEKEKADYKAQADKLVTNDKKTGYADLIDQDPTAADIKGHLNDGIAALNELETKAKAIGRINDAATNAKAQIDQNNDLTAAQKTKYEGDISTLVSEGTQAVKNAKSADIDTTAQEYIDQINNVPKTAGSDLLDAQRDTAKQAVEAAAKKASDAISAISDDLLDPATKTKYNKQITDAENAATSAIDAATTAEAITSAQNTGINNISDVSLAAEKASALTELAAAKDKDFGLIDADLKDGSIDDETAQNAKANINSIYTQAVVKITTKDNDIKTVDDDKNKAIDDMDKIAENIKGSQEEQDVRKAKKTAIDELAGLADKVKTEIAADKNLSQVEKDGYTDQVDQALANAKNKINAATTTDEVTKNENAGKADITQVENDASLQSAKDLGLADIQKAKKDALDQVKKLTNVDDDTKNQLNSEINDAYDAAKDKIESPDPATADQVNKNAQEGVTNINNVVSDLNVAKAANKRKLAKYAEKAIDRIDANTDLAADDKTKIEQAINDARDKGITDIDAVTTTVADVEAAEKAAEDAIDTAATVSLDTNKTAAKQAVEDAATKAKNAIENNKFLDADSKTKYEDKIEAAQKAAETAIDAATTANAITSEQARGINDINNIYQDASLAAEKASALTDLAAAKDSDLSLIDTALKDGSIDDETAQNAKANINSIYTQAVVKITTKDNDIETVDDDKNKAIKEMADIAESIKGSQEEQDVKKAKKTAIDELAGLADKVKNEIAANKNLSQLEKDGYTDRVDQALANPKHEINAATTTDEVTKNEAAGKADITKVENDASLQSAKDLGLNNIQQAKKDALDQVKKLTNVDEDTKNQLNSEINDAYDAAKDKIESPAPATADQVNKNAQEGVTNINNVVSDLNVAKAANKRKLAKYAEKAIDRIDANTDLTADDKTKIEQAINDARDKGITDIDAAKTSTNVETAEKAAEDAIDAQIKSKGNSDSGSDGSSTSGGSSSDSQGTGTNSTITGNGDINGNNATNKNPGTDNSEKGNSAGNLDVDLNNSKEVKLMHNAYVYDIHGNRANQITLGAGSIIRFYGIKNIAGVDYYIVVDQGEDNEKLFVKVANAEAAKLKLKHNSYVYNKHGKRVKKDGVLKKGVLVYIYGGAVKIRGKKYYIIDSNRYIKAANVAVKSSLAKTSKAEVVPVNLPTNTNTQNIVEKDIIHNSYLYDDKGRRANKLIFLGGSIVNTTSQIMIDGKLYYKLDDGLYIKVNNVDGKKSKLTHNAFIYSKHGNRIGKKVLKKNSLVKTYGAAIKINHKKFYLIDKDKYVKEANF